MTDLLDVGGKLPYPDHMRTLGGGQITSNARYAKIYEARIKHLEGEVELLRGPLAIATREQ